MGCRASRVRTRGHDLTREINERLECGRSVPEVAKLFVFLASSLAGSITGTEFTIDGGTVSVA
nr:SDR family oxidoreductase [Novosphingobium kaempferiae]